MPESIEHNASITGRIFEPYCNFLMAKMHITEKVNNSNRTIRQLTVLLKYIDLFCHMHFEEQRCASATYPVLCAHNCKFIMEMRYKA